MTNSPDRELAVFSAARRLPAGERAAYLSEACGGDWALRRRVEELLQAGEEAGAFLQNPASGPGGTGRVPAIPGEKPGDRIGRYKLLQQIGEGGCGVVFMAEQEEPVHRRVALKVIKLGMDTKNVIARFEAERQALALMDHPNIAKVLDAGATDTGRPYFVMELVRGVKITDYCDQNSLATRERLDLFTQVCRAIQHAHQKGIIHRDIKPSNILVTLDDRAPVPKVIDFGIAKATQGKLTDQTLFTAFEQFIGTPAYMSPEQAEMRVLDIDTRSDIYSLGVLLYELLTGRTPFDVKKLSQAGLDEIRRTICEQEPAPPSTSLSTMPGAELTTIANHRQVEPPKLIHLVRGDLDWIVMKALEKDRTRRYDTASGLAADIQRHLKNEPVAARPPSALYRFQQLLRRNKLAFVAAGLLVLMLVAATGISAWQVVLARQRLAESAAISKFMTEVFLSPDPARDGRTVTVAEALGTAAKKVENDLADQPTRRAKLQAAIGGTYFALGLYSNSISLQEQVRDYYLSTAGPKHPDTLTAMHQLARSYFEAGRWQEAVKLQEAVLALRRKILGPEHPDTIAAMSNLAIFFEDTDRRDEALKLREQVLVLRRKVLGPEHPDTLTAMENVAISYQEGRPEDALQLRERVLELRRKVLGPEHPDTITAMHGLADSYYSAHRAQDAIRLLTEVLALRRKVNGPEHSDTLWAMNDLGIFYSSIGNDQEAIKLLEEELALRRQVNGPDHPDTIRAINDLANAYGSAGREEDVIALMKQAFEVDPTVMPALATWQLWFGEDADYDVGRRRLVQQAEGTDQAPVADRAAKAACLRPIPDEGLRAKALTLAQRGVDLGKNDPWRPWYLLSLGMAEYRNAHFAAAAQVLPIADEVVSEHQEIQGTARLFYAMCLFRQNQPEAARKLLQQSEAQMPPLPQDERKPHAEGRRIDQNLLIWWLAYKEARELIEMPSPPVAKTAVQP